MKHVDPIKLEWEFNGDSACLKKEDVQRLREYIIRLNK